MKIVGIDGLPVKACCSFMYRGYEISISTIFNTFRTKGVAVFNPHPSSTSHQIIFACDHPQSAIEWIDATIAAKHRAQPLIHPGANESFANQCEAEGIGMG